MVVEVDDARCLDAGSIPAGSKCEIRQNLMTLKTAWLSGFYFFVILLNFIKNPSVLTNSGRIFWLLSVIIILGHSDLGRRAKMISLLIGGIITTISGLIVAAFAHWLDRKDK